MLLSAAVYAALPDTIEHTLPSIVGVGTVEKTRRPPAKLAGTGFVVGDGRHVITNAHVIPEKIDTARLEYLAVFTGKGDQPTGASGRGGETGQDP